MDAKKVDVLAVLNEFAFRVEPFGDEIEAEAQYIAARDAISDLIRSAEKLTNCCDPETTGWAETVSALARIGEPS
ncbi:hypothetical protein [Dyella japonica]|uniref:Uncharacterized protein n=1 Tax=Dyella japonica TaxID=231455 RepID=A0ABV2K0B5_9GAMM